MSMNPNEGQSEQGQPEQGYPSNQGIPDYAGNQGYPPPPVGAYRAPTSGFNFQDLYQRWRTVLSIGLNPERGIATFDAQQPAANWPVIWIGITILAVVEAVFGVITGAEYHVKGTGVGTFIGDFISTYIGFFLLAVILFAIARYAFSGTGTFLAYSFVLSLIYVPLGIISSVAGIIPILGGLIALAAGIYEVILAIYATSSSHRLTLGKSTAVVLIPIVVLLILSILAAAVIGVTLFALGALGR